MALWLRVVWLLAGTALMYGAFLVLSGSNATGNREGLANGQRAIAFTLDPEGGALLAALTRKNAPSDHGENGIPVRRHLAIVLDGLVLSAPTINSEISTHGQISGNFSDEELDRLTNVLRAGAMRSPGLRPRPVAENAIDEAKVPGEGAGTVLVYAIDPRRKAGAQDAVTDAEMSSLVAKVTQAIESKDVFNVTVRPAGKDRIEVNLRIKGDRPEAKDMAADEVKRIKRLLSKVAALDFRVLANSADDKAAIDDAIALINSDKPEFKNSLEQAQRDGLPPQSDGLAGEPKMYDLVLCNGAKSRVAYDWLELGPNELQTLGLDNAASGDPKQNEAWKQAEASRGKVTTLKAPGGVGLQLLRGALFYSRECKDKNLPEKELAQKKLEYFVLARKPEIDPATGKETSSIGGTHVVSAYRYPSDGTQSVPTAVWDKMLAQFVTLRVLVIVVAALTIVRRWIRVPWEFIIGQLVGLFAAVFFIMA
jgi:hypothetical protein